MAGFTLRRLYTISQSLREAQRPLFLPRAPTGSGASGRPCQQVLPPGVPGQTLRWLVSVTLLPRTPSCRRGAAAWGGARAPSEPTTRTHSQLNTLPPRQVNAAEGLQRQAWADHLSPSLPHRLSHVPNQQPSPALASSLAPRGRWETSTGSLSESSGPRGSAQAQGTPGTPRVFAGWVSQSLPYLPGPQSPGCSPHRVVWSDEVARQPQTRASVLSLNGCSHLAVASWVPFSWKLPPTVSKSHRSWRRTVFLEHRPPVTQMGLSASLNWLRMWQGKVLSE